MLEYQLQKKMLVVFFLKNQLYNQIFRFQIKNNQSIGLFFNAR